MFDGQSEALRRTTRKGAFSLWALRNTSEAFEAARQGAWVAGWFMLGYGLPLAAGVAGGHIQGDTRILLAVVAGAVILAGVLAYFLYAKQARWAAIVLLCWALLEAAGKLAIGFAMGPFIAIGLAFNLALAALAARAVRGAFKLAEYRRAGPSSNAVGEVFD